MDVHLIQLDCFTFFRFVDYHNQLNLTFPTCFLNLFLNLQISRKREYIWSSTAGSNNQLPGTLGRPRSLCYLRSTGDSVVSTGRQVEREP